MFGWEFLVDLFWTLSSFRGSGMNGPLPLTPSLVLDWCSLMSLHLDPNDVRIIFAADRAFLAAEAEEAKYRAAVAAENANSTKSKVFGSR